MQTDCLAEIMTEKLANSLYCCNEFNFLNRFYLADSCEAQSRIKII